MKALYNEEFLLDLIHEHSKEIWVRIIAINKEGNPLSSLEGKTTGGSVNIDGASSVRRTCSLTFTPTKGMEDLRDFYWGLNTRFTLEIGLTNFNGKIMKKQRGAQFDPNIQYYLKVGEDYQPLISCTEEMFKEYHDANLLYVEIEQKPYGESIIWFPQGTYVCASFSSSINANSYSVNISGKDKMCLLNGEMGGNLTASIDFGQLETIETSYIPIELTAETYKYNTYYVNYGSIEQNEDYVLSSQAFSSSLTYYEKQEIMIKEKIPIAEIIKNLLIVYAEELETNIVIKDLEEAGVELLQYRGDEPMYMFYDVYAQTIVNQVIGKTTTQLEFPVWESTNIKYTCATIPVYENLIEQTSEVPTYISYGNPARKCSVIKLEKGDAAGYRLTQLVYAGELIANQGETITSVLDKIKNMLGDFEYFYDEDGRFIFQRKRTYANVSWNNITEDGIGEQYVEDSAYTSAVAFSFEDADLITAVSNSPQLGNIKNDFAIWGKRESASGADIPILYRYAIDVKPTHYTTIGIPEGTIDKYGKKVPAAASITYDTTGNIYVPITKNVIYQEYKEIEKPDINDYKVGVYYILEDKEYQKIVYNREEGIVPVSGVSFVPTLKGSVKYRAEYYSPYDNNGKLLIDNIQNSNKKIRFINSSEISKSLAMQNKVYDYKELKYYSTGDNPWIRKITEPIGEDTWFEQGSLFYDYYYGEDNQQLIPVSKFYNFVNSGRFNIFEIEETESPCLKIVTYDIETKEEVIVYEVTDNYLEVLQEYADMGYDNITQQNWFFKRQYETEWTPVKNEKHLTQLLKNTQSYLKFPYSLKLWEKGLKTEGTLITSDQEYRKAIQDGKRIGKRRITLDDEYYYWNEDKQSFELVDTEEYYYWDDVVYRYGKDFYVKDAQAIVYDWREIIYRMADDYYKYYDRLSDFNEKLKLANPQFYNGKTGYEKYYTDIYGFWRQLYNPDLERIEYTGNSTMEFQNNFNPNDNFYYLDEETGKYVLWNDAVNTRSLEVVLGNKGAKNPVFMLDNVVLTSPEAAEISAIGVKDSEGKIVPVTFYKTVQNYAAADIGENTIVNPNKEDPEWANNLGLIGSRNTLLESSEFKECKIPDEKDAKETRKVVLNFYTEGTLEKAEKEIAVVEEQDDETVITQGWSENWMPIQPAKDKNNQIIKTDFPAWILIENASNQEGQLSGQTPAPASFSMMRSSSSAKNWYYYLTNYNNEAKYSESNPPFEAIMKENPNYTWSKSQADCQNQNFKGILCLGMGGTSTGVSFWLNDYIFNSLESEEDTELHAKIKEFMGDNISDNWPTDSGTHALIGRIADPKNPKENQPIETMQILPWDYVAFGLYDNPVNDSVDKSFIQLGILTSLLYSMNTYNIFEQVIEELCQTLAYLCKTQNIDPMGTIECNGLIVPAIASDLEIYEIGKNNYFLREESAPNYFGQALKLFGPTGNDNVDGYCYETKGSMNYIRARVKSILTNTNVEEIYKRNEQYPMLINAPSDTTPTPEPETPEQENPSTQQPNTPSTEEEISVWDATAYVNTIAKEGREFAITFKGMNPQDGRFIYKGDLKNLNEKHISQVENLIWLLGFQVRYNGIQIYYRDSSAETWIPVEVENATTSVPESQITKVESYGHNWNWAYAAISSQAINQIKTELEENTELDNKNKEVEKQLKINAMIDNAATVKDVIVAGSGKDINIDTFNNLMIMKRLGFIEIYYKEPVETKETVQKQDAVAYIAAPYYTKAYLNPKYETNKGLDKYLRFVDQDSYNKFEGEIYNVPLLYDDFGQAYEATQGNYNALRAFNPIRTKVNSNIIPNWSNSQKGKWLTIVELNGWKQYMIIDSQEKYKKAVEDDNLYLLNELEEDEQLPLLSLTKKTYETETYSEDFIYKMSYQFYPNKEYYYSGRDKISYRDMYLYLIDESKPKLYYKLIYLSDGKTKWQEYDETDTTINLDGANYKELTFTPTYYHIDLSTDEEKEKISYRKNKYYAQLPVPLRFILIENKEDFLKFKNNNNIYIANYNEDYRWISKNEISKNSYEENKYYYVTNNPYSYVLINDKDTFEYRWEEDNLYLCNYTWISLDENSEFEQNKYYTQIYINNTYRYNVITSKEEFEKQQAKKSAYIQNFSGYAIFSEKTSDWKPIPPSWQYWIDTTILDRHYEEGLYKFKFSNALNAIQLSTLCQIKNMEQPMLTLLQEAIRLKGPLPFKYALSGYQPKNQKVINGRINNVYWLSQERGVAAFSIDTSEDGINEFEIINPQNYKKKDKWNDNTDFIFLANTVDLTHTKPFYRLGEGDENYDFLTFWNYNVNENPAVLNFWFDFMDSESEMGKYSIPAIGDRTKVINNDKIKAIYFKGIPNVLLATEEQQKDVMLKDYYETQTGYKILNLSKNFENCFAISARGITAQDELDNLLYQHLHANESISLTCLPVYYLAPNTRIMVRDDNTGICDEYIVTKISLPLTYNGTSNITATKVVNRLY